MIDVNTMEGIEQLPPHITLEANVVWENLGWIVSPTYELIGEKMCSSKLKKTGNSPKLETKDVLDYFDEPFSPANGEKICSSKLKKPGKSSNQMLLDEESEDEINWKWPSFSGMEPVVIQNCIVSVTNVEDTMEDMEQSVGHEGGDNLRRYFQFSHILKQMFKVTSLNISFF